MCRQCFREKSKAIGFVKVSAYTIAVQLSPRKGADFCAEQLDGSVAVDSRCREGGQSVVGRWTCTAMPHFTSHSAALLYGNIRSAAHCVGKARLVSAAP